jgi:ketosteroid isomerase-like protein
VSTAPENLLARLGLALQPFLDADLVMLFSSSGGAESIRRALGEIASPDLVTLMIGGDQDHPFTGTFHGVDGFIDAWRDYSATFSSLYSRMSDLVEVGPDVVYAETEQTGVTATAGMKVEYRPAAIFRFEDGLLQQAEFHLDRVAARKAAGLPPRQAGG